MALSIALNRLLKQVLQRKWLSGVFPARQFDMPTLDEKKAAMGAKSASDSAEALVIPRFQIIEIPPKVGKAFPDLVRWNRENHAALEQWRERTNVVLNRAITPVATAASEAIVPP